jgi:hypothetical protein
MTESSLDQSQLDKALALAESVGEPGIVSFSQATVPQSFEVPKFQRDKCIKYDQLRASVEGHAGLVEILKLVRTVLPLFDITLPDVQVNEWRERSGYGGAEVEMKNVGFQSFYPYDDAYWRLLITQPKGDEKLHAHLKWGQKMKVNYSTGNGLEWSVDGLSPTQVVGLLLKLMGVWS